MVSFEVDTRDEAIRVAESTELFFLAESLGGVESLIELPGPMTTRASRARRSRSPTR